jgi:hypothetical protein
MRTYLINIFLALDYAVNALLCGLPNETLSSRAYRMQQKPQPYWHGLAACINCIFFWQNNHCRGAYAGDRARLQVPLPEVDIKEEMEQ